MAEYIVKETLQAKLNRKKAEPANKRYTEGWNDAILMVKSMIHSEKAADAAPVRHGRWKCNKPGPVCGGDRFDGLDADIWADWEPPYCPNCGAKMDGGDNSATD